MPNRVGSAGRPCRKPASVIACNAAPAANRVCRPQNDQAAGSCPSSAMSQPRTSAEIFVGNFEASKIVVRPTPEAPATRFFQSCSTRVPSGVMQPMPVITTRRLPEAITSLRGVSPVRTGERLARFVPADLVDMHLVEPPQEFLRLEEFRHALSRLEVREEEFGLPLHPVADRAGDLGQ